MRGSGFGRFLNCPSILIVFAATAVACGVESDKETVASFEIAARNAEDIGVTLDTEHLPDMLPRGPEGLYPTSEGFAIPDNHRKNIVFLDESFDVTSTLSYDGIAQGVAGVDVQAGTVTILDGFADRPSIVQFQNGLVQSSIALDSNDGLPTGLARDDLGLIVEYENGVKARRIAADGSVMVLAAPEYNFGGTRFILDPLNPNEPGIRTLHVEGSEVTLQTANFLGTARILSGTDEGVNVLVEDVTFGETVAVRQSVMFVSTDGKVVSRAEIPEVKEGVYIPHGIAIRAHREPIVLTSSGAQLRFWQTTPLEPSEFVERLPISQVDELGSVRQPLNTYPGCLTQAKITQNANEYLNVSVSMTAANINNPASCDEPTCARQKPAYLGSAGTYSSVSYNWGGWDTPTQFVNAMASGKKAGNMNDSRNWGLTCTYGVDCSGFTARIWGVNSGSKPGTTQLAGSSYTSVAYGPGYYTGDAFILSGSHVLVYVSTGGSGLNIWESVGGGFDRVIYRNVPWSHVSGWLARHSNNHCNT